MNECSAKLKLYFVRLCPLSVISRRPHCSRACTHPGRRRGVPRRDRCPALSRAVRKDKGISAQAAEALAELS